MDQGPIKITKLKYRNMLLCKVIGELTSSDGTIVELLKKHTIKDTIVLLKKAWDDVSTSVLAKSWKNMLQYDDDEFEAEDLLPLSELMAYSSLIHETQSYLIQLNPNASFTDADIEQWNNDHLVVSEIDQDEISNETDDDDDEDDNKGGDCDSVAEQKTSHNSAMDCVNQLLKWCNENQSTTFVSQLLDLRKQIVDAAKNQPKKQTKIGDFFANQT